MPTQPEPTSRPAEFDARVMAYLPGLKKLALKYVPKKYADDLVTDTIIYALGKWRNYREDGGGFWNWLAWGMRGIVKNQATTARAQRHGAGMVVPLADHDAAVDARQDDALHARDVLKRMSRTREGRIMIRRGLGDQLDEIGKRRGIGKERVRQLEMRGRAKFAEVA